jgi:hypothetical protein
VDFKAAYAIRRFFVTPDLIRGPTRLPSLKEEGLRLKAGMTEELSVNDQSRTFPTRRGSNKMPTGLKGWELPT